MKQIIFTAILVLAFCIVVFAQANENPCQKININAPETVQSEETFKVFASFEKESQPVTSKFNWTIIKGSEVIKANNVGMVEVDSKNIKDVDSIIILAESSDGKCKNTTTAKIFVAPACGLPYTIDEYAELPWNDEKARLENLVFQMQRLKDMELFAFFEFNKKTLQVERKNYLAKVLNYLSATGGLEKSKITFLISESEGKRTYFQPFPKNTSPTT